MNVGRRNVLVLCLALLLAPFGCGPARAQETFTFVQLCDPQGAWANLEAAVGQINALKPDFVLVCGDLVEKPKPETFEQFTAIMKNLAVPYHCVPGNHDVGAISSPELLAQYHKLIGPDHYAFEHKGFTFVGVNTQLWKGAPGEESKKQDEWLVQELHAASKKKSPIFVVGHIPIYWQTLDEKDRYRNLPIANRKRLLELFEAHGVVAYLSGHLHVNAITSWNRIQLVSSDAVSFHVGSEPLGFRVWIIGPARPYKHEFVPVKFDKVMDK